MHEDQGWQAMKAWLSEWERALAAGPEQGGQASERTLKARAEQWAQVEVADISPDLIDVLWFELGGESYGIEGVHVAEAVPLRQFTPLPGVPAFVLGIVNLRGRIVSVVDLRVFFDMELRGLSDRNQLVVLHDGEHEFGLLADRVLGMEQLDLGVLQAPPANLAGLRARYARGVTSRQQVLLDGESLLSDERLRVNQGY